MRFCVCEWMHRLNSNLQVIWYSLAVAAKSQNGLWFSGCVSLFTIFAFVSLFAFCLAFHFPDYLRFRLNLSKLNSVAFNRISIFRGNCKWYIYIKMAFEPKSNKLKIVYIIHFFFALSFSLCVCVRVCFVVLVKQAKRWVKNHVFFAPILFMLDSGSHGGHCCEWMGFERLVFSGNVA